MTVGLPRLPCRFLPCYYSNRRTESVERRGPVVLVSSVFAGLVQVRASLYYDSR